MVGRTLAALTLVAAASVGPRTVTAVTTECLAEFENVPAGAENGGTITCNDCDPNCDSDGARSANGSCTFTYTVCQNEDDTPGCPAPVTKLAVKGKGLQGSLGAAGTDHVCGVFRTVVATKNKNKKPGKGKVRVSVKTSDKKKDKDKLTLVCNPQPAQCPVVTSTTVPGGTTTSTTVTTGGTTTSTTVTTVTTTTVTTTTCPPGGLGVRNFTLTNALAAVGGSHFFSTGLPGNTPVSVPNSARGALELCGGVQGLGGVAELAVNSDSIFGLTLIAGQGHLCVKVEAAGSTGKIACSGGLSVDVDDSQDSNGPGPEAPAVLAIEQGAPRPAGSAYLVANVRTVQCSTGTEACPAPLTDANDCANPSKVDFSKVSPETRAFTTGTFTGRVTNPIDGGGLVVPTKVLARTGKEMSCTTWATDSPGILEMGIIGLDSLVGDTVNMLQIDD